MEFYGTSDIVEAVFLRIINFYYYEFVIVTINKGDPNSLKFEYYYCYYFFIHGF